MLLRDSSQATLVEVSRPEEVDQQASPCTENFQKILEKRLDWRKLTPQGRKSIKTKRFAEQFAGAWLTRPTWCQKYG